MRQSQGVTDSPTNRAERRKLENRGRILSAARQLFIAKGFAATTTAEIAEAADVGKGSVFFQAGSKERLLVLVFQEDMSRWLQSAFGSSPGPSLLDDMARGFEYLLHQYSRTPELAVSMMRELPWMEQAPDIAKVMEQVDELLRRHIDAASERGTLAPGVDAYVLGRNLFALYYAFQLQWLGRGCPPLECMQPTLRVSLALQIEPLLVATRAGRRRARTVR